MTDDVREAWRDGIKFGTPMGFAIAMCVFGIILVVKEYI